MLSQVRRDLAGDPAHVCWTHQVFCYDSYMKYVSSVLLHLRETLEFMFMPHISVIYEFLAAAFYRKSFTNRQQVFQAKLKFEDMVLNLKPSKCHTYGIFNIY